MLAGIWLLGLVALGAVIAFERRVDSARQAQVVIAQMHIQQGNLLAIAFAPATAAKTSADSRAQTRLELTAAKNVLNSSVRKLAGFGHSTAPATIAALDRRYFTFVDRLSALVAAGASQKAAFEHGTSEQPGGIEYSLTAELNRADIAYGADAARSRDVSLARHGRRDSVPPDRVLDRVRPLRPGAHDAATGTRARTRLTGLGNRRKLFADLEPAAASLAGTKTITVGIFDLDGFKAYNDTFGHPAGDALLARLGAPALDGRRRPRQRIPDRRRRVRRHDRGRRPAAAADRPPRPP